MTGSHVFVVLGDLTHIACDAWMLPTDSRYAISDHWASVPGLMSKVRQSRTTEFSNGEVLALAVNGWDTSAPLPILTAVPLYGVFRASQVTEAVAAFIQVGAGAAHRRRLKKVERGEKIFRTSPLLAMPAFGTDGGGGALLRGEVLRALLNQAQLSAAEYGIDVVMVLRDIRVFSLAQELRTKRGGTWASAIGAELVGKAKELAEKARAGKLVPFMGAGVSISAGAPDWAQLLGILASGAGLSESEARGFDASPRSALDKAAYLRAEYGKRLGTPDTPDGGFADAIVAAVSLSRYGLAPALLASLHTEQAITLNYDELFEMAAVDAGDPRTVIPGDSSVESDKWLLKLHGSVAEPGSIVLTRDDYIGYNASRQALSAIVKATLITHHLLFVGFGLKDDHFYQIIHDVRQALPSDRAAGQDFATALTLQDDPLDRTLWEGNLTLIPMGGPDASIPDTARTLEIFLDALLAFATDGHSYLLAPGFEHVLTDDDRRLKQLLLQLADGISEHERDTSSWPIVERMLTDLGWEPPRP